MAVYGYCRVSTAEQVSGSSLPEQNQKIQGAAMILGKPVDRIFTDGGVSGSVPLSERPEGGELFAMVTAGDTVIASKLDRLFRDATDAQVSLKDLEKRGVDLIIVDIGVDSVTRNGSARLVFGVLASVAEWERSRIKERQADGIRNKRAAGGHTGGKRKFGYRIEGAGKSAILVPIPEEQDAIERMKRLRAEGLSFRDISAAMIADGFEVSHVTVGKIVS
jgi:DNA invertase Pin-like site-specific DNA recombinase